MNITIRVSSYHLEEFMRTISKIALCLCFLLVFVLPAAAQNAPQALPDSFSFSLDGSIDIVSIPMDKLLSNDSTSTGLKTVASVGLSARGITPTINGAMVEYPLSSLFGSSMSGVFHDTFAYSLSDGTSSMSSYVSITLLNSPPQAADVFVHSQASDPSGTSFSVLLGVGSYSDSDCDDLDRSSCAHSITVESPPSCGSISETIEGLLFTLGAACPSDVFLIPYHVTDPWGVSSNTAFFHVVHQVSVGESLLLNSSFDTVVQVAKQWLPSNFRFSGSLYDQGKIKVVTNPLYEAGSTKGENPMYCGHTDHLLAGGVNQRTCSCTAGFSGASCGLQISNVPGGRLKIIQTVSSVVLTDADTLNLAFVVNSRTGPFDLSRLSAKIFVVGTDVVFTCPGELLVGHELAHVVQQSCSRPLSSSIPGGAPVTLKIVATYKSASSGGLGTGKVSISSFNIMKNVQVAFPRPGDVDGDMLPDSPLLALPLQ